jgi:hypothetical protein
VTGCAYKHRTGQALRFHAVCHQPAVADHWSDWSTRRTWRRQFLVPGYAASAASGHYAQSAVQPGKGAILHRQIGLDVVVCSRGAFVSEPQRDHAAARLYRYPRFREVIAQMGRIDWLRDPLPSDAASP